MTDDVDSHLMGLAGDDTLFELAEELISQRRFAQAQIVLRHMSLHRPTSIRVARRLIEVMFACGQIQEALESLATSSRVRESAEHIALARWLAVRATEQFNTSLASGQMNQALPIAEGLANLFPQNPDLLTAAMECNIRQGRLDRGGDIAQAILKLDPAHKLALDRLNAMQARAAAIAKQMRVNAALSPPAGTHPLIQLRDLHDAVSAILCEHGGTAEYGQVLPLLTAASTVSTGLSPEHELFGWEKHYRLALEAIATPLTPETPAISSLFGETQIATTSGQRLEWSRLSAHAAAVGAQSVFFVAADMSYVKQYAPWFVKSLRKNCDVPFLVLVHAIGGANRFEDVVSSIGDPGPDVLVSGDAFDAAAVMTKCYDTPPKGLIDKPVAHYQSVRFLRLKQVLSAFQLPVFVSDIDLLLQRGVSDLLDRCRDVDIVLNENLGNVNAGSRITANLLLVKPSAAAACFLDGLENFLNRALSAPEVSRWIDQFGLFMARHRMIQAGLASRIGYFDTESDINNLMYRSYQKNPFRFLSLYHGFDMDSLEREGKDASNPLAKAG